MSGRTVVLLVNLGTPDDPTAGAIRKYLKEFLSDRRVIGTNRFLWWFVLRLAILPRRPAQLVSAYQTIWREDSPIRTTASDLVNRLRERLVVMDKKDVPLVEFAMTYGMPSVSEALERLSHEAVERIVVIPLFPQYSKTTTEAVNDRVSPAINRHPNRPALLFSKDYHDHPLYIDAIADSVAKRWQRTGRPEKLLISFHGLPIAQSEGDPYAIQCKRSAELIARALDLPDDDWRMTFQSRRGNQPWLQPYTDETLVQLAKSGTGSVSVVCPGFAADCLETLYEIDVEARKIFLEAGGRDFQYIPALNAEDGQVELMLGILRSLTAN